MLEKRLLKMFEQHFSPTENASSNRRTMDDTTLPNTPRKRRVRKKKDRSSARYVHIKSFNNLKVVFSPERRARTEISTTPSEKIAKSTKKSSDGSHLQQRSKISTAELPVPPDVKNE